MINNGKHSKASPEVMRFAEWLDAQPGVVKVMIENRRTRKVASGRSDPKFKAGRNSVQVQFHHDGTLQMMRVFAQKVIPASDMRHRLEAAYARQQSKQPNGMSPKDAVHLPARVLHLQGRAHAHTNGSHVATGPAAQATALLEEEESVQPSGLPDRPKVKLGREVAGIYSYALSLSPTGQPEFQVDRLYAVLIEKFPARQAQYAIDQLKRKGLVKTGEKITHGFGAQKRFTVVRREIEIVDTTPAKPKKFKASVQPKPKAAKASAPSPVPGADTDVGHLAFFRKNWGVLAEAERRRKALKKHGYDIVDFNGKPALVPADK